MQLFGKADKQANEPQIISNDNQNSAWINTTSKTTKKSKVLTLAGSDNYPVTCLENK